MIIPVKSNSLAGQVQQAFQKAFPYLRVEFYRNPSNGGLGDKVRDTQRIAHGRSINPDIVFNIVPEMTVNELENYLKREFNVKTLVFRKAGSHWLQTTMTDDWTLNHQNNHGKEISDGFDDL